MSISDLGLGFGSPSHLNATQLITRISYSGDKCHNAKYAYPSLLPDPRCDANANHWHETHYQCALTKRAIRPDRVMQDQAIPMPR